MGLMGFNPRPSSLTGEPDAARAVAEAELQFQSTPVITDGRTETVSWT